MRGVLVVNELQGPEREFSSFYAEQIYSINPFHVNGLFL